ncbi:vacuolar protein sorting-associated protein light [Rhodnius prolixus]
METQENNTVEEVSEHDESEEEESSEEEIEPKLKYMRMSNDLRNILSKDAASCVAVHPKFLCVGTDWGIIHLLDHQGNNVWNRELRAHSVAVNQISIDANGDYIASCSDDGKVIVFGLYSSENSHDFLVGRLVRSVAIDPFYYKSGSGRRFITGDERLVLHEKSLFSRLKSTVLGDASVEGGVTTIKWSPGGELLAWATNVGFRVYDLNARTSLGLVKWTNTNSEVSQKCHLCWDGNLKLIAGRSDSVRVCTIRKKSIITPEDLSIYVVHPVYNIQTEYIVCGVGPLGDNLVVLGCPSGSEGTVETGERPQLQVLHPEVDGYTDLGIDCLSLRGFPHYRPSDYSLECLVDEGRFVIVSPRDIVVACPYDSDDRIDWLLTHKKFDAALEAVSQSTKPLARHTTLSVGRNYIDYLIEKGKHREAALLCQKILGVDKGKWEIEVMKFAAARQLRAIADLLPTFQETALPPSVYEMVLNEYLSEDVEGFLKKVKTWPPRLYNLPAVVNAVLSRLLGTDPKSNPILLEALAVLYSHMGKHDKALTMYIKLQNKGVFELIKKHNLYLMLHTTAKELMKLDKEQAVATMMESKLVQPADIVAALSDNQYYLYVYLDALDKRDTRACQKYHSMLVQLYAYFDREKLLRLLNKSDHYAIEKALEICKAHNFYDEMVFLLDRIGNPKEALALIMSEIKDIERAINFCKEHDDQDLWEDLINYSLDKPSFITTLLKRIATYVDPRILVQRVQNCFEIPKLKEALVKMMHDYNLQVSLQEDCNNIIVNDFFDLHEKLVNTQQRGSYVGDDHHCGACHRKVIVKCSKGKDVSQPTNTVMFYCSHVFHSACLPAEVETCTICSTKKHITTI